MIGDTKETLSAKTGKPVQEIYEDEVSAVVVHGDDIDSLEGWQWDLSKLKCVVKRTSMLSLASFSLQQARGRICADVASAQTRNW